MDTGGIERLGHGGQLLSRRKGDKGCVIAALDENGEPAFPTLKGSQPKVKFHGEEAARHSHPIHNHWRAHHRALCGRIVQGEGEGAGVVDRHTVQNKFALIGEAGAHRRRALLRLDRQRQHRRQQQAHDERERSSLI